MTKLEKMYLNSLRTSADAYRYGTFDRWGAITFMAGCIESHLRRQAEIEWRTVTPDNPGTPPALTLPQPLSDTDQLLQALYPEAITYYLSGMGKLRLIK
jgi:hypothetical protein